MDGLHKMHSSNFWVKPSSEAVLHMSRMEFNELSSCEVQHLDLLKMANWTWTSSEPFFMPGSAENIDSARPKFKSDSAKVKHSVWTLP